MNDEKRLEEARREMDRWEGRREEERRNVRSQLERKLNRYSEELRRMSTEDRLTLLAEAKQRGLIEEINDFILDYIHLYPDKLGAILEEREHERSGI